MKIKSFLAAIGAVAVLTVAAFAADPSGSWTYSMAMREGGTPRTTKFTLANKDGALTGSVAGRNGDTAISNGSFKDGAVSFDVTRDFGGNSFTIKYSGKLSDDGNTITGKVTIPGRDGGEPRVIDWTASRAKAEAAN
ncbi:MAG TPA: hypothetical protein VHC86_10990 [Opitutaceae bacterium]|nr:hypothetical protein [Opitutaceae bacterium]